jgi:hypothetical protein
MKLTLGLGKLVLAPDWSILVRTLFQFHYWLLLLTVTTQTAHAVAIRRVSPRNTDTTQTSYAVATRRVTPRNADTIQTAYAVATISDKPGILFLNSIAVVRS